jgi:hypothetical protein
MIPRANITAWRTVAPWPIDAQVEQDLVISHALVELSLATIATQASVHAQTPSRPSQR